MPSLNKNGLHPMSDLNELVQGVVSSIEPRDGKANAPDVQRSGREALVADAKLTEYGVNPVLIGSYKRSVSIKRVKDVGVFVRLPDMPSDVTSKEILDRFFTVLHKEFGRDDDGHQRAKRQDRSLQVSFPDYDLYVAKIGRASCRSRVCQSV